MQISLTFDPSKGDMPTNLMAALAELFTLKSGKTATPMLDRAGVTKVVEEDKQDQYDENDLLGKKKRKRRTKAEMEAARAGGAAKAQPKEELEDEESTDEAAADNADDYDFDSSETEEKAFTFDEVQKALANYSIKHGRAKAGAVLKEFLEPGSRVNVNYLKPERYADIMRALT